MLAYALPVIEYVPTTYQEVRMSGEAKDWKGAMDEMDSLYKSYTWELVNHPKGKKVIRCKWVFTKKDDLFLQGVRHKAKLVAKGYAQKELITMRYSFRLLNILPFVFC